MDQVSKLLRKKQRAEEENNQSLVSELCNKLGSHFMNESKFQEALSEFRQESNICLQQDRKMDYGRANRMIGEVFMLLGRYKDALKHEDIYLKMAKQEDDLVELQRAYATIGRCYLLMAEDSGVAGSSDLPGDFKAAEKSFLKSLIICKDLSKSVSKWELADMQARLYLNLGVTKEHIEDFDEAISNYETAIKICKANDLFELHHKCLMAAGFLYESKRNNISAALNVFNAALEVAKRIQDKNEKVCETLLAKSGLLVKNGDFQSARQVLKRAHKLKSPNGGDKEAIQKSLKVVLTLCKFEDELVITNSYDYKKRKELFEKLGDGSCKLKNYSKAIDFYLKSLEAAKLNGEGESQLIPILVSLYQTYKDNKDYDSALIYMKKEFELIENQPKEAAATLLGIGNLLDLAGKDFWEVDAYYRKALTEARKAEDAQIEKTCMQKLVKLCRSKNMVSLAEILEQEATGKGIELTELTEETEYSEDLLDISSDLNLDDELSSDPESSENERKSTPKPAARKKRPSMTVKKNAKGETRLHEACINGNYQLAKMLIDQGHALNVRDNAGWLPLHEAAIHGFRDVVELLLDNGAQTSINDKGGTSCDGITPLYDAASNGNLSVVQLLLDRGAKATVKTDFNETPLEALIRWHESYGAGLSHSEMEFYEEIKLRLKDHCEKVGIDTTKNLNTSSSGYNSLKSRSSQKNRIDVEYHDPDDPSDSSDGGGKENESIKKTARLEYKNVMSRLKNPHKNLQRASDEAIEAKRRAAHLTVEEVDPDEWLDDDMGPSRKKQKIGKDKLPTPAKNFSRKPSANVLIDSDSDREDFSNSIDAFDVVMNAGDGVKNKPKRRNSNSTSQIKSANQPSLLESGFVRFVEEPDTPWISPKKVTASLNDSFGRTTVVERQLVIKVQVADEKIIVPVNRDSVNELKISWLTDEAARRYYCIKGIRPELNLKTSDGATLLRTDPVALILSLTDENLIHSEILDWKLPSLSKRYLEACSDLKCAVDQEISELLEINRAAISLDLSNQNLRPAAVRPILKALQYQNCLLELDLSSNFIQNEGVKFLTQTLTTLKQPMKLLDLSGNMVTDNGLEYLSENLSKNPNPLEIQELKLSFNSLKASGLKWVSSLCQNKNVQSLSLMSCDLTDSTGLSSLSSVKSLNISYNHLTSQGLRGFLKNLSPNTVEVLNLEKSSTLPNLGDVIVDFINSNSTSLRDLNLSGLNLDENEILDILRSLEKCDNLTNLNLSHLKEMTFITLKYILSSMESRSIEFVKLIGCRNLMKLDSASYLQHIAGQCPSTMKHVQLSLPRQSQEKQDFVERMRELWDFLTTSRGKIETTSNVLDLMRDDIRKEIQLQL